MNHWALVRIGIVAFVGISSSLSPADPSVGAAVGWDAVAVGFLFFPVIVCIGLCVLLPFGRLKLRSNAASWNHNPFDFSQPEQFVHMIGYCLLVSGAGISLVELWRSGEIVVYAFAPVAFGAGILLGLRILWIVARRQVQLEVRSQN